MSKEKIEEIWDILTTDCDRECVGCEFKNDEWCFTHFVANKLYNAGYRKQSEGKWIKVAAYNDGVLNTAKCSVCGTYQHVGLWDYHPYCPHCGAKMEGGDRDA